MIYKFHSQLNQLNEIIAILIEYFRRSEVNNRSNRIHGSIHVHFVRVGFVFVFRTRCVVCQLEILKTASLSIFCRLLDFGSCFHGLVVIIAGNVCDK